MNITVAEFLDYIESLAVDNDSILDLPLNGFIINNEIEIKLESAE
jgi:hypothetical protein